MSVRFMSYNIQHGLCFKRQVIDLDCLADTIRRCGASVCGLNEVRNVGRDFDYTDQARQMALRAGWNNWYFAEAIRFSGVNPYGNGIVSKFPIISAETVMIPDPPVKDEDAYYETRCILRAVIDVNGHRITMLDCHMGLARSEQRNAVASLVAEVKKTSGPVIVMGDFNLEPDSEILQPLFTILDDTAALLEKGLKSWPSDAPRIKIDYVLTRGLKVVHADIPQLVVSDHCPYIVDIEL